MQFSQGVNWIALLLRIFDDIFWLVFFQSFSWPNSYIFSVLGSASSLISPSLHISKEPLFKWSRPRHPHQSKREIISVEKNLRKLSQGQSLANSDLFYPEIVAFTTRNVSEH